MPVDTFLRFHTFCTVVWSGDEAVSVSGHPTNLDVVGQEPTVLTSVTLMCRLV